MSAWVKQIASQVKKKGEKNASWYCEWNEPDGTRRCKSCGPGKEGKKIAKKLANKIKTQLILGTYKRAKLENKTWSDFREDYERYIAKNKSVGHFCATKQALGHFERIAKPKLIKNITSDTIEKYVTARSKEWGNKQSATVSPATVNKELRHIRAALRFAVGCNLLLEVPKIKLLKQPKMELLSGEYVSDKPLVRVCVFKREGRKYYEAQWTDPETGLKKTRSTRVSTKHDANRIARNLENQLNLVAYERERRDMVGWRGIPDGMTTALFQYKNYLDEAFQLRRIDFYGNPDLVARQIRVCDNLHERYGSELPFAEFNIHAPCNKGSHENLSRSRFGKCDGSPLSRPFEFKIGGLLYRLTIPLCVAVEYGVSGIREAAWVFEDLMGYEFVKSSGRGDDIVALPPMQGGIPFAYQYFSGYSFAIREFVDEAWNWYLEHRECEMCGRRPTKEEVMLSDRGVWPKNNHPYCSTKCRSLWGKRQDNIKQATSRTKRTSANKELELVFSMEGIREHFDGESD